MKRIFSTCISAALLIGLFNIAFSQQPTVTLEGSFVVHPANRAYFNSPIATFNQKIYTAFIDEQLRLVVAQKIGTEWQTSVVDTDIYPSTWHNAPSIAVDTDGFIHVVYNMHSTPWQYSVSKNPENISEWEFRGQNAGAAKGKSEPTPEVRDDWLGPGAAAIPGNQISYPFLAPDRNGRLYIAFRECFECDAIDYYERSWAGGIARYDVETKIWERIGRRGPWAHDYRYVPLGLRFTFDMQNRMHASWIWNLHYAEDNSHETAPNIPAYAFSRDDQKKFNRSDDYRLELPLDVVQSDTLWSPYELPPNPEGYFFGYTDIATTSDGTPYVLLQPKAPGEGRKRSVVWLNMNTHEWSEPEPLPYAATRILINKNDEIFAISSGVRIHKRNAPGSWSTFEVDTSASPCLVVPDYQFFIETDSIRIFALQNRPYNPIELQIYTVSF